MHDQYHTGKVLPLDIELGDDADLPGNAQPVSQDEIDDILSDTERSTDERVERLQELRRETVARRTADTTREMDALLTSLDAAIAELSESGVGGLSIDPQDRSDVLSPEELFEREEEREAITEDVEDD